MVRKFSANVVLLAWLVHLRYAMAPDLEGHIHAVRKSGVKLSQEYALNCRYKRQCAAKRSEAQGCQTVHCAPTSNGDGDDGALTGREADM